MHFLHISRLIQLPFLEDISHVSRDDGLVPLEQLGHLRLRQPDRIPLQPNFQLNTRPVGLVKDNISQRVLPRRSLANTQRFRAAPPHLTRLIDRHDVPCVS